jgi:hypothetical protein
MVPLLNVPWQKVQVPVDVCLGMMCPFLAPGVTALAHSVKKRQPQYTARRPFLAQQVASSPTLLTEVVIEFLWASQQKCQTPSSELRNVRPQGSLSKPEIATLSHTTWDGKYHVGCRIYPAVPAQSPPYRETAALGRGLVLPGGSKIVQVLAAYEDPCF